MKKYNARWASTSTSNTVANVDFSAANDAAAIKQADKIGKQLNVQNQPRTIYNGTRFVA